MSSYFRERIDKVMAIPLPKTAKRSFSVQVKNTRRSVRFWDGLFVFITFQRHRDAEQENTLHCKVLWCMIQACSLFEDSSGWFHCSAAAVWRVMKMR